MKRPIATALALSLAALALSATAPMAGAAPSAESVTALPQSWYSAPTESPTADPQHPVLRASSTAPTSKTGTATISVTGVYPGDRLDAEARPADGRGNGSDRVFETGGPNETATITLPAPPGGWRSDTRYGWFVLDTDHGLEDHGHFQTPAWDGAHVDVTIDAQVQPPKTRKDAVVFTITGAKPGVKVEAGLGRSTDGYTNGPWASAVTDAKGRAVVTVQPEGAGWDSHTRYIWWLSSEGLFNNGSFTMPTWTRDGHASERPAPTTTTKPRDGGGGLSKTGV